MDEVLARIRNLKVRELPDGTLFPVELTQIRPLGDSKRLHNCIAHQDYGLRGRIQVVGKTRCLAADQRGRFCRAGWKR